MIKSKNAADAEQRAMQSAWRALEYDWSLSWPELRALLPDGGEERAQPPAGTERRMRILIEINYRLGFADDDDLRGWLRRPSTAWGGYSPLEVMAGPVQELRRFRRLVEQGAGS